jgi:hypothetical protein
MEPFTNSNINQVIERRFIMQKRLITITLIFCLLVFLIGCVTALKDYKPKSSVEEAIKTVLVMYETEWNKHNEAGVLALYHDRAKIMYGRERTIASKKEYANTLPRTMAAYPTIKLGAPKISITGEKADVKVILSLAQFQSQSTFYLVRERSKWLIMSFKY